MIMRRVVSTLSLPQISLIVLVGILFAALPCAPAQARTHHKHAKHTAPKIVTPPEAEELQFVWRQFLATPHYRIAITSFCAQDDYTCTKMLFQAVHQRTGKNIRALGGDMNEMCKDGVTICRHLGWRFNAPGLTYVVTEEGTLKLRAGKKTLMVEKGVWTDSANGLENADQQADMQDAQ